MYSHADIWNAIDRLAVTFGYSPSGLAKKAGLDPTTFNKSKRISADGKPRWPSTESIAKILSVTGTTMAEFFSFAENGTGSAPAASIPVRDSGQAAHPGCFNEDGVPQGPGWDSIALPLHRHGSGVYALRIEGHELRPLYRDGDIVVVEACSTPRRGDRVVARTMRGEIVIGELARLSGGRIEITLPHPDHAPAFFRPDEISWMARIAWASQ